MRILVVDDHAQVRAAIRKCLELSSGWTVCGEADNGETAIEMASRLRPDVVLLDYAMPVMNGIEAARVIGSLAPHSAMVLFSMYASEEVSQLARAAGVRAVVSEDIGGMRALVDTIEEISRSTT